MSLNILIRRHNLCILVLVLIYTISSVLTIQIIETEPTQRFEPTWDSLDKRKLPKWYDRSKIGIFIHWGIYSVPQFGSEWFWFYWRTKKSSDYVKFMETNYIPNFTYQEFAKDFTAELFNATEWVDLFEKSGAKYVVITTKHHDGYALWPSKYSFSWNSIDVGPHRDIIGELSAAIQKTNNIHFGIYHSLFEWYNPMYIKDEENNFTTNHFVMNKILPELYELIELYKPSVLWSDGDVGLAEYWKSTEFLAWLYNDSPVAKFIVTNDRWGTGTACKHGDFYSCADRYNPGTLQQHKWENAMTIDKFSWGHRANAKLNDYLTSHELIKEIVSTVSCGGNILINIGPTKTGVIEPIFCERLEDIGGWLKINGEAIYDSVPWIHQNDTITSNVWYTYNNELNSIYAMILEYPFENNRIKLYSLFGHINENKSIVNILGFPDILKWSIFNSSGENYVEILFPKREKLDKLNINLAWTLKITT